MLGKLIKYDLLADYKKYIIVCAAMLGSSVMMLFFDKMTSWISNNTFIRAMAAVFAVVFFFICLLAGCMVIVLATVRFYNSVMRSEAYLTHTLPVSTWQVIASKLATVYIWYLLMLVMSVICSGIAFGEPMWLFKISDALKNEGFRSGFEAGFNSSIQNAPIFGDPNEAYTFFVSILPIYAGYILLSPLCAMASVYFSCALGNLFSRSKLAMSVLMFFLISFVQSVIGGILGVFMSPSLEFIAEASKYEDEIPISVPLEFLSKTLTMSLILSTIFSIGFLIAAERIFAKKLNLE